MLPYRFMENPGIMELGVLVDVSLPFIATLSSDWIIHMSDQRYMQMCLYNIAPPFMSYCGALLTLGCRVSRLSGCPSLSSARDQRQPTHRLLSLGCLGSSFRKRESALCVRFPTRPASLPLWHTASCLVPVIRSCEGWVGMAGVEPTSLLRITRWSAAHGCRRPATPRL